MQKFKLNIANTIINQQNSGIQSMGTDQILDLFQISGEDELDTKKRKKGKGVSDAGANGGGEGGSGADQKMSTKNVLESLENLWDEKQYEEEYNLDSFIAGLK